MHRLFPTDSFPGACANTLAIAERVNVDLDFGRILLPSFPVPSGETEVSYLRKLVDQGHESIRPRRCTGGLGPRRARVEDHRGDGLPRLLPHRVGPDPTCSDSSIRVGPGRGSAAGSIVSYCLRITDLDPLAYGLIFERFLNPGRRQMPDIDMDFDERYAPR